MLEAAVGLIAAGLSSGADLLIVNKFGKHEAEGRGYRDVIAEAVTVDIPVLVGLDPLNRTTFKIFAGGRTVELLPDPATLKAWIDGVTATARLQV